MKNYPATTPTRLHVKQIGSILVLKGIKSAILLGLQRSANPVCLSHSRTSLLETPEIYLQLQQRFSLLHTYDLKIPSIRSQILRQHYSKRIPGKQLWILT